MRQRSSNLFLLQLILVVSLSTFYLLENADALKTKARGHLSALHRGLGKTYQELIDENQVAQELWFRNQRLDHFNPENPATWSQRYFINDTFWDEKNKGPVFMILGGEGPISSTDVANHFVVSQYAQTFNALVISVEHRFYGKSQPTGSTDVQSLKYLTTPQALADYALFQDYITQIYNAAGSKWIVFGGSYSGNLAAWYRMKYPHLAAGAIASSAPVEALLDFTQYLVTIGAAFSPSCYSKINTAIQTVEKSLQTESGRQQLALQFKTCGPISTDPNDIATFMEGLVDGIAGIVQYNNDNNNYQPYNVVTMCNLILNSSSDPVTALSDVVLSINAFNGENCTQVSYETMIKELSITLPIDTAGRAWTWQTCTEYGYFQTGESPNQPFSSLITLQFFENICRDAFGFPFLPNTNWTNTYFGGTAIKSTKIVFPNGSVDPWHNLGVLQATSPVQTIFINGTAHCADLYPPTPNDLPGLTEARQVEVQSISRWLVGLS